MSPQLQELVIEYGLAALQKQMRFDAWLGRHGWRWERETGLLTLRRGESDELICATQALGSVSRMSETWTWIWANELAEVSDELMTAARQLRALGEERRVPELVVGEFPHAQVDGHLLSLVAMGILNADAYFRGAYLGGEGFVLIDRGELRAVLPTLPPTAEQICEIVTQVDVLCTEHRRAIKAYLHQLSWQLSENETIVMARNGNQEIQITFEGEQLVRTENLVSH